MERNLTNGSVLKNILYFSLPYLLSYFLQTVYGMADLFIIGQYNGVSDITAVSIGSQVMHMLTVMIVGLAMGSTVMISRAVGANEKNKAAETIGNTIFLFIIVSISLTLIMLIVVKPLVDVMSTPKEAVNGTISYLTICFIGIPFITAYNIISSVLRGLGDSKSPMYFIAAACIVNVILDYFYIGVLKMGAAGAALGTVSAQTLSVFLAIITVLRRKSKIKLNRRHFKIKSRIINNILKVGIPVSLQDGFIQISFIIITIIANRRGINDAAAVGIVEKIIGFVFLVPSSMLSTVSVMAAQNIGAGKHKRASQTLKYGIAITVFFGFIVGVLIEISPESVIGMFTKNSTVKLLGAQYISSYIWDCMFAGIHFCFSGYFCAYGKSEISFLHNILSIVLARVPGACLLSHKFPDNLFPMGIAAPVGSILSVIICIIAYILLKHKKTKSNSSDSFSSTAELLQ